MGVRAPFETYEHLEILVPVISGASASIFILLISIIMLAIQLNQRFASLTTKYLFDRRFTGYLLLLLSNIFIPILILPFPITLFVHIEFVYTFVVILALIPFFAITRDRLKIGFIIKSIKKEIDGYFNQNEDKNIGEDRILVNPSEIFVLMDGLKNIIIYLCDTKNLVLIRESLSTYSYLVNKILKKCDRSLDKLNAIEKQYKKFGTMYKPNKEDKVILKNLEEFYRYREECNGKLKNSIDSKGNKVISEAKLKNYKKLLSNECRNLLRFYSESGENSVNVRFIFEIYSDNLRELICDLAEYEIDRLPINTRDFEKRLLEPLSKSHFMSCCERLQNLCWKSQQSANTENVFRGLKNFKEAGDNFKEKNEIICAGIISWVIIIGGYACYKIKEKKELPDFRNIINRSIDIIIDFIKDREKIIDGQKVIFLDRVKSFNKKKKMEKIALKILNERIEVWIQKPNSLTWWNKEFKKAIDKKIKKKQLKYL